MWDLMPRDKPSCRSMSSYPDGGADDGNVLGEINTDAEPERQTRDRQENIQEADKRTDKRQKQDTDRDKRTDKIEKDKAPPCKRFHASTTCFDSVGAASATGPACGHPWIPLLPLGRENFAHHDAKGRYYRIQPWDLGGHGKFGGEKKKLWKPYSQK